MKKMNVLLAALALAVTAITPLASSASDLGGAKPAVEVSATYESSYTITIPDGTQDIAEGTKLPVGASGRFEYGETVSIYVESSGDWKLKDKNHEANKADISYSVTVGDKTLEIGENKILEFTVNDTIKSGETIMTVSDISAPTYAGTYGDTLTFTATTVKPKKDGEDAEPANTEESVTLVRATTTAAEEDPAETTTTTATTEGGEGT